MRGKWGSALARERRQAEFGPLPRLLLVFASALVASAVVVSLFAGGIRLVSSPRRGTPGEGSGRDDELDEVPRTLSSRAATAGGIALFVLSGVAALAGLLLIVH